MTPEERHALADRLDRAAELNERTAKEMGGLGYGWANAAADLRAAAAALREMPSTEEVVTAARASLWEQMESEAVERLTDERDAALAKVADLNAEITQLGSDIEDAYAERAAFSAEVARLREGIEAHRRRVPTEQTPMAGPTRWRKKPVEIEAMQWNPDDPEAAGSVWGWLSVHGVTATVGESFDSDDKTLSIPTLEGVMTAQPGDWVIRGVQGEFYPCKPDIFAATYEPASVSEEGT